MCSLPEGYEATLVRDPAGGGEGGTKALGDRGGAAWIGAVQEPLPHAESRGPRRHEGGDLLKGDVGGGDARAGPCGEDRTEEGGGVDRESREELHQGCPRSFGEGDLCGGEGAREPVHASRGADGASWRVSNGRDDDARTGGADALRRSGVEDGPHTNGEARV